MSNDATIFPGTIHRAHRVGRGARSLLNCLAGFHDGWAREGNVKVLEERVHGLLDELKAAEDNRQVVEQVERDLQEAVRAFAAVLAAPFVHYEGG